VVDGKKKAKGFNTKDTTASGVKGGGGMPKSVE